MTQVTFSLAQFNGPLDLLLALLQKNKMDIYEIRILELIDQFLAVVEADAAELDQTSEFVEMAARLVHMKSVLLLPKSEEAERVRQELTGLLIEYSACKEVAAKLTERGKDHNVYVRQPVQMQLPATYSLQHEPQVLLDALLACSGRERKAAPQAEHFEPLVSRPVVSVTSKILYILRGFTKGAFNNLKQLFRGQSGRSDAVATFLALLELVRGGRVTISEDEALQVRRRSREAK